MHYEGDEVDWNFKRVDQSRPPLRWIANLAGSIASAAILRISIAEDHGKKGLAYVFNGFLWDTFWPIYNTYGTFYKMISDEDKLL